MIWQWHKTHLKTDNYAADLRARILHQALLVDDSWRRADYRQIHPQTEDILAQKLQNRKVAV